MDVGELPLPGYVLRNLERRNIKSLYPPQIDAVRKGVLDDRNLIVSTPTASGKTLTALLAASIHLARGGKVLYLVPLRALASEKLRDIEDILCSGSEFKAAMSTGDYDSSDPWLRSYDVIVSTNEKADSLIRHGAEWIRDLTLVVVDELHLISDPERGPTLEMVITWLRRIIPEAQFIGLSATMSNVKDLGEWLDAEIVQSDWRPVPLREGVLTDRVIEFKDGEIWELKLLDKNPVVNAVLNILHGGGQALVFTSTRKRSEEYAIKIARAMDERLDMVSWGDREKLKEYATEVMLEERSSFTENLARLVEVGVAFHHAGLSYHHRRIVEEAFRSRVLKAVVSTPTLAAGVNLPARLVIITDVKRYVPGYGYQKISVMEYKQFCGRAGRPGYDEIGYAVTLSKTEAEKNFIIREYVHGELEKITSKLGSEKHLRVHILTAVSTGKVENISSLLDLLEDTYLGHLYGTSVIRDKIRSAIGFLSSCGFVETSGATLKPTRLGVRVSQLYIDPLTAWILIDNISKVKTTPSTFGLLHLIASTPEVPKIPMKKLSPKLLAERIEREGSRMIIPVPDTEDEDYEEYIEATRLAMLLEAWIEEMPESEIYDNFGVQPGDMHALREASEWIAYSSSQIMKVAGYGSYVPLFERLHERIKHGIREELIPLARLRGIGRVRARALYRAGYTSPESLKALSVEELMKLLGVGKSVAERIMDQL